MSADNGIYIIKFPDGYRVAYASAIDNIDYYPENSKERKNELKEYFGESFIYSTYELALLKADEIYKKFMQEDDFMVLEYGICYLGEYESFSENTS